MPAQQKINKYKIFDFYFEHGIIDFVFKFSHLHYVLNLSYQIIQKHLENINCFMEMFF